MAVREVFIVGSGLMGSGISQVCAQAGLVVTLCDVAEHQLEKAVKSIGWSVGKLVEKGKLTEPAETVMARIGTSTSFEKAKTADLVLEVVFENIDVKKEVYGKLNPFLRPDAIVASNTSAIPISELAVFVEDPTRFLGLHFFSPVPMMQAVEVIRGVSTSSDAFAAGKEFALSIGKEPIMVNRDVAGFVINRINFPSAMEAMRLVEAGVASIEDIDKGLRLASGRKMGIFETGDMVGLDVTHGALMSMYRETGEERWYPPLLLRRKVKAGQLGRKTGAGWYRYDKDGNNLGPND